jgi:acyl-CoA synthetase (AMP-forming)/AMP-acid ligase II
MPNKPEYIATWLGLGKIGVITALINTNLRMQSLVHCLTIAKVKAIIYADELAFGKENYHSISFIAINK